MQQGGACFERAFNMAEVVKAVDFLLDAAHFFHKTATESNGKSETIKVSIQCLATALSLVLPPSREAEIRLMLGELLLKHTENAGLAVEHLQKAYVLHQKVQSFALSISQVY